MKTIQVLGTGCSKCRTLERNASQAVEQAGIDAKVAKVTDIMEITSFGVMTTPALAIDGEVKIVGKVPSPEEIAKLLA
jgi:small redox-active disulfide protein 2